MLAAEHACRSARPGATLPPRGATQMYRSSQWRLLQMYRNSLWDTALAAPRRSSASSRSRSLRCSYLQSSVGRSCLQQHRGWGRGQEVKCVVGGRTSNQGRNWDGMAGGRLALPVARGRRVSAPTCEAGAGEPERPGRVTSHEERRTRGAPNKAAQPTSGGQQPGALPLGKATPTGGASLPPPRLELTGRWGTSCAPPARAAGRAGGRRARCCTA